MPVQKRRIMVGRRNPSLQRRDIRDFWERTAQEFGARGYKAVRSPTSLGLVNWYEGLLQDRAIRSFILKMKGATVLDAGCGVGRWTILLKEAGSNAISIDISVNMVLEARRRMREKGIQDTPLVVCSIANLPFRESCFDSCFSVKVLQHVLTNEELLTSVSELLRVTKSGSPLFLLEASPRKRRPDPISLDYPTAYRSTAEWLDAFSDAELQRVVGVDVSLFRQPLETLARALSRRRTFYRQQVSGQLSTGLKFLKVLYYVLVNLSILFSLPFDLSLRNFLTSYCQHKLFILKKTL